MTTKSFAYNAKTHVFSFDPATEGFFNLAMQITKRCGLNCLPCCESDPTSELQTPELVTVVKRLEEHAVRRVCLTGGEPTIRKDFVQIVNELYNAGIIVTLASNCYQIIPSIPEIQGKVANIRATLFGTKTTHDNITKQPGSYRKLQNAVSQLLEAEIPVYACMTLMQSNLQELEQVWQPCQEWGIEKLLTFSLMNKGRGKTIFERERVTDAEVQRQLKTVTGNIYWTNFMREGQCAMIQPDGNLIATPCYSEPTGVKVVGSVLKEPLLALWQKYPYKKNYLAYYGEKTE